MMIRQMTNQSFFFRLLQLFFSFTSHGALAVILDQRKVFDTLIDLMFSTKVRSCTARLLAEAAHEKRTKTRCA